MIHSLNSFEQNIQWQTNVETATCKRRGWSYGFSVAGWRKGVKDGQACQREDILELKLYVNGHTESEWVCMYVCTYVCIYLESGVLLCCPGCSG
jgi:hypothetical protein